MTDEQVKEFHREIGEIIHKYKLSVFVGIWFEGDSGESWGPVKSWNAGEPEMKRVADYFFDKLEEEIKKIDGLERGENWQGQVITGNPEKN